MKKIIRKFWGVALIVMLLSTLFIAATPASAGYFDPLTWQPKLDAPSGMSWALAPGSDVNDFAVSGTTMYAALTQTNGQFLLQSSNAGGAFTDITARLPGFASGPVTPETYDIDTINYVAIAPDNPNVVVVADASSNGTDEIGLAITDNGGATWSSMGSIVASATATLAGIAISPAVSGGFRYIAAYGVNAGAAVVYYYNFGAGVGAWKNAFVDIATGAPANQLGTPAFAFSPSFMSDYMAVVITHETGNATQTGKIFLNTLSFNAAGRWNADAGYPVTVTATAATANNTWTINKFSIALAPDYDGSDEATRIVFAGGNIVDGATQAGGVWLVRDNVPPTAKIYGQTSAIAINSVAYDGTNVAAGAYESNTVYRSSDALASSPTFLPSRNLKKIGIDTALTDEKTLVKFDGDVLYGSTVGNQSAISKSLDYGNVWNDYTCIDSGPSAALMGVPALQMFVGAGTVQDIYVSAAGDPWYLVAKDATAVSIYRMSMFSFQKVMCVALPAAPNFILRGIDADAGVVYAASLAGTDLYYTADGGLTRWYKRATPAAVKDMAVEDADTVYIGQNGGVVVYKSTTRGFSWDTGVNCKITNGTINSMTSVGAGNLLIGGTAGAVVYSTDGGATYTATMGLMGGGATVVAATGLAAGDYIFAAHNGNNSVWRYKIGQDMSFESMNMPAATGTEYSTGLVYKEGVLYALSSDGTNFTYLNRSLSPAIPGANTHIGGMWGTRFAAGGAGALADASNLAPTALKATAGPPGTITLYRVNAITNGITWFADNVYSTGPELVSPATDYKVEIISSLMGNVQNVNFVWNRVSLATAYQLQIALDPAFLSKVNVDGQGTGALAGAELEVASGAAQVSQLVASANTFLAGQTYYWRVRAYAPIVSAWSEARTLIVQATAATVPNISSPEIGSSTVQPTGAAFSWTPVSATTMYRFELSTSPDFTTTVYTVDAANAGAVLPGSITLDRGTTYFWRVKALAPVEGGWSTVANFMVAEEVVEPTVPPATTTTIVVPQPTPTTTIVTIPPPTTEEVNPGYIWAIIIIGAVLVIAVIVLIVRTRRSV